MRDLWPIYCITHSALHSGRPWTPFMVAMLIVISFDCRYDKSVRLLVKAMVEAVLNAD